MRMRLHSEVAQLKRDLKTKEKLLRLAVNLPEDVAYLVSIDRHKRIFDKKALVNLRK